MKLQQDLRPNAEDTYTKSLEFVLFCTHKNKSPVKENHYPTHKGRRTPENKLTGEASKKNSKTKRPYRAQGATLRRGHFCAMARRTRHVKQQNQDFRVCVFVL
jgi:hypothetical protein